ncbi:MAG TPA: tRNA (guanosine(37)-N1)-methyltransferase TrmD, partial [bacterium]|nr:tRNA (guanosine(37)-N1)-methyltransferase TrmD [bacterium]
YRGIFDYPHYTRPYDFRGYKVPDVLLSGDHKKIELYRRKEALKKTLNRRPELLIRSNLTELDMELLQEIFEEIAKNKLG